MQWQTVKRLEKYFFEVSFEGDIGPAQMGRTAAKMEGLDQTLHRLQAQATELHVADYRTKLRKHGKEEEDLSLVPGSDRGGQSQVVGSLSTAMPVQAQKLVAERVALPREIPEFDPTPLFDEPHRTVYQDPISLATDPACASEPPRVKVHANRAAALAFVEKLDSHHRLRLAKKSEIRSTHLCGAFALCKDAVQDRLILDARPANELENTLTDWVSTLGSVQAILQLELPDGMEFRFCGTY